MTKRQIAHLIREQRPEPPEGYEAKIERTLDRLMREEQNMKKRYKVSTMLLAAALIVIALAGAAYAARELRLFSAPFGALVSQEGTEDRVVTNLGSAENELVRATVEEALYDGKTIALLLSVVPQNPEQDAVLGYGDIWIEADDVYDLDVRETENGGSRYSLIGRKDGRRVITFGASLLVNGRAAEEMASDASMDADGGEQIWLRYELEDILEDATVHCELQAHAGVFDVDGSAEPLSVSFDLTRVKDERTFEIVPVGEAKGERFEILRGYLTFAKAMTYMTLDYSYIEGPGEDMGIDFRLFNGDGERIDGHSGEQIELGGSDWRLVDEMEAVEEIPEAIILEAKVIGEDKTLGRVECRLVETDSIRLPDAPEEEGVQLTFLTPKGSWVSDHMRLLFAEVRETTGLVSVMFTCDGGAETAQKLRFTLLDANGQPMELKNMLDEAGNPKGQQQFDDSQEGFYRAMMAVRDGSALSSGQIAIEARMEGEENPLACFEGVLTNASSLTGDLSGVALVTLPVDPNLVFTAGDDARYHTRPNCGQYGISYAPMTVTLAEAVNMGKTACPNCCEGAE
ncbi:MAG: hypothetical protein IJ048_05060 [Clostridia bacterium]|nr:hypothetical protein [Clostridia bacterium]